MTEPSPAERLFTYDFAALALAASFGFCNIAVFYGFAAYLERLGLDPVWRGPLLAAEPLAAFCLRPFLSVLLAPRGALALARLSMAGRFLWTTPGADRRAPCASSYSQARAGPRAGMSGDDVEGRPRSHPPRSDVPPCACGKT